MNSWSARSDQPAMDPVFHCNFSQRDYSTASVEESEMFYC